MTMRYGAIVLLLALALLLPPAAGGQPGQEFPSGPTTVGVVFVESAAGGEERGFTDAQIADRMARVQLALDYWEAQAISPVAYELLAPERLFVEDPFTSPAWLPLYPLPADYMIYVLATGGDWLLYQDWSFGVVDYRQAISIDYYWTTFQDWSYPGPWEAWVAELVGHMIYRTPYLRGLVAGCTLDISCAPETVFFEGLMGCYTSSYFGRECDTGGLAPPEQQGAAGVRPQVWIAALRSQ